MLDEKKLEGRKSNAITEQEEKLITKDFCNSEVNRVYVCGKIQTELKYAHEQKWEKFYKTKIRTERISGTDDFVPLIVSEKLIQQKFMNKPLKGKWIEVIGQLRSYNKLGDDGLRHLEIFLFAKAINICEECEESEETVDSDEIYLDGYICAPPICRKTPLGRLITEIKIAVNRAYGKSDYIPCIAWDRIALWASELEVGNRIEIHGRVQSRKYFKRNSQDSNTGEYREVYEVSIRQIRRVEEN